MRIVNFLLGACAGLLAAAAFGAVWSLFALATGGRAPWMAVLAAVMLVLVLRFNGHVPGAWRALAAASLLAVTIAHANYVMAAGFIAGSMGSNLVDGLRLVGVDMAFALARAHGSKLDIVYYLLAFATAIVLGMRQPGEGSTPAPARAPSRRT